MTLSFEVKGQRSGSSTTMAFAVEETSSSRATIHCLSCGEDAPVVQLEKQD
jgi:hypothetical protein